MFATAAERTAERCVGRPVLAIQDTTVVRSEGGGGTYLHAVLAVDQESGAILGLISGAFLHRTSGRRDERRAKPTSEKESQRWLSGMTEADRTCAGASSITHIADRESDIYSFFAGRPPGNELVVRVAQDRALAEGERLFARVDGLPVAGRATLELAAQPGRKARTAQLAVRFMPAQLARPVNSRDKMLPASLSLTLIDLREDAAPAGEAALHWRLFTTRPVATIADALAVADLYRRRWCIEQLFRTLKTKGFDIEGVLVEDEAPFCNLVAAAMVAAVTIQQMVHARDGEASGPLRPAIDAFEEEDLPLLEAFCAKLEGKTDRQKNPHPKGSLAFAAWVCARLGGWTGYYGKPGPIVMLSGWVYFQAAKQGAILAIGSKNV